MRKSKGFTLIELMIVVAIIGIVGSIAMVMYGDYVIAANRTEGRSALQTAANTLEKCRSLYGSYTAPNCNYANFTSETGKYDISATSLLDTSFTLQAAPSAGSPQNNDTDCTSLTLTNTGLKGGAGADPTECW